MADAQEAQRVREELRARGYAVCRGVIARSTIDRARAHLEAAVSRHLRDDAPSHVRAADADLPFESRLAHAYATCPEEAPCSWINSTRASFVFQQLLFRDETLCALIEALSGRPPTLGSRYNVRSKLPDVAAAAFPWHQDYAFFRMQQLFRREPASRLLAVWAPLTPVGASNGGVELLAGSHARGYVRHQRKGGFFAARDEVGEEDAPRALPSLDPTDVLIFTDLTLHRSGLNTTAEVRWSADWAFVLEQDDDICPAVEPAPGCHSLGGNECAVTGVGKAAAAPTAPAAPLSAAASEVWCCQEVICRESDAGETWRCRWWRRVAVVGAQLRLAPLLAAAGGACCAWAVAGWLLGPAVARVRAR